MFDIDYLTDSMNYILVSLENQTNPHAGTSELTNSAGTLQTPYVNASEELIVAPTEAKHTAAKKEAYPTGIPEDTPESLAFRRELVELAQKQLREVPKNKATKLTIFNKPQKGIFDEASYDDEGMVHDFNNLPTEVAVSPIPTLRIHNIHPQSQILGDPKSSVQTRSRVQQHSGAHALVEAMQEELLQFRLQQVWILVDLPHGAKVIGTKWVYRNKRDERGVVVRNKGKISGKVATDRICFVDPDHPKKVYKVVKALYGLHQAPRAWYATLLTFLETHRYRRDMLKKFDLASVKTAITPMETKMALTKDEEADEVDVHLYRSMIGYSQDFTSKCVKENL
ncbi:putative ribonuclease H-like domain-containing protein [Tanacetum coccineum]|uniref:Ribonuclease H-like domain-containing protein n=1 Tax=Tanacetum coccineum TaxID=301880 RepID=A0ABQ5E2H2_9ASTR